MLVDSQAIGDKEEHVQERQPQPQPEQQQAKLPARTSTTTPPPQTGLGERAIEEKIKPSTGRKVVKGFSIAILSLEHSWFLLQ